MARLIECPKCCSLNKAGTVCDCVGYAEQKIEKRLWADELQIQNMKLKLDLIAARSKIAEVVSIARLGRYSGVDSIAVGKRLDEIERYLIRGHDN
jgi:ribosomal protein L32